MPMHSLGWLAFDIDGTLTLDKRSIPAEVVALLRQLAHEGWRVTLATGRPYAFARMAVHALDFPFQLIVQNGAAALEMPTGRLLWTRYLPGAALPELESAYAGIPSDFLVYAGVELGDFCYYRPNRFPVEEREYLAELQTRQQERWQAVERFDPSQIRTFPLAKCFGPPARIQKLLERLGSSPTFEIAHIRELHAPGLELLLVTQSGVSKGSALQKLIEQVGSRGRVIVAGDDENDLSLFDVADVAIAMPHAPQSVLARAHHIAPPTSEQGIIRALQKVLRR